ncbi:Lipase/esterase [Sinomonas atrocyanea]|uniref:Lipase/esterase n=1 Tax=Sinomonas atrocyanea TaxID=37927 RepID=A0A126ZY85_9MICC|nr:alpha/beta hydrolase [Sinomonas atrocyanea]AMM31541.1 Lipase/esterase [Sinomonas atrocyanea]GEB66029.1 acetylhydrolase [Sinomonas atrocyanea]GGG63462.1 acetylhydrolase [Sinomonas atrocyanea]
MTPLNGQAQQLLDTASKAGLPPVYEVPVDEARERMRKGFISGDPEEIDELRDLRIPGPQGGIPARLYRPASDQRLPLVVFFHGGGWTVNDLDTHDRLCAILAKKSGCAVLSVDYRRSPEAKYPAAVDDAYSAYRWALDNARSLGADANATALAGDSSGGTLAAAVSLLSRDRRGPRADYQLLLYPALDYFEPSTPSYEERGKGYSLDKRFMEWSWRNYLPDSWDRDDPYLFPLRAHDLKGLPKTLVLTAEFDPLRDEGTAYAERLQQAGVLVEHIHLDDQMHGFAMQTRAIDRARETVLETAAKMGAYLLERQRMITGDL